MGRFMHVEKSAISKAILPLLAYFLCLSPVLAQPEEHLNFRRITIRDGLSQTSANCFLEDRKGFVWVGTFDGLNRFDGLRFRTFHFDPQDPHSISDNSVTSLVHGGSGALWVGTNNGLNRFDEAKGGFQRFHHDPGQPLSLPHDQIWCLMVDDEKRLWVGSERGVSVFEPETQTFKTAAYATTAHSKRSFSALSMYQDRDGRVWVGTWGGGLFFHDKPTDTFLPYTLNGEPFPFGRTITAITQDRHGDLWLGSMLEGLSRFDNKSGSVTRYQNDLNDPHSLSHNYVKDILEDSTGNLWVGTYGGGLDRYDPLKGGFVPHKHDESRPGSLSDDAVMSVYEDSKGAIWVGTFIGGINRYKRQMLTFSLMDSKRFQDNKQIWSILEDDQERLWFGGQHGIFLYDVTEQNWKAFGGEQSLGGLPLSTTYTMHQGSTGGIWAGGSKGVFRYVPEDERFEYFSLDPQEQSLPASVQVYGVLQDGQGQVWVATDGHGLHHLDPAKGDVRRHVHDSLDPSSLSSDKPRSLLEDRTGVIWIGTQGGGLNRYLGHGRFEHFSHIPNDPESLSHNHVLDMIPDRRDQTILWLATAGGLNRFTKRTGKVKSWRKSEGLPNDYLYALGQDVRGLIWVSTNRGLAVFDPGSERFRSFDVRDGLPSNEFNAAAFDTTRSGRMYFGSLAGVVSFHPRDFKVDKTPIPLAFTDFLIDNRPVRTRELDPTSPLLAPLDRLESITLSHRHRMIGFDFAGLEFSAPWQCRYAYFMEGFDKDWLSTPAENTRATYTNLPAGQYVFRVKATNPDGYWTQAERTLQLTVLAPIWLRTWAKVLYAIIAFGLLALYVGLQRGRLRRQRQIAHQERQLKEQAQLMAEKDRATAQRLENQVKERTSLMITQEKMATLGMLSSGVAHELNNPNNFVYGGAQSLEHSLAEVRALMEGKWGRSCEDPDITDLWDHLEDMGEEVSLVQRGATRIRDVVAHMEQFVRKGQAYTRTNLVDGVESTVVLVRSQYPEVLFEVIGDQELYCLVRPGEINQVFLNLVLNACEAIERKRQEEPGAAGRLVIEAISSGNQAILRFEDTGIGFSLEQANHLFEAFFTTKIGGSASGLGLYTSWQIVHDHHGTLDATSEPGLGSIFTVNLPLMKEKQY